MRNRIRKALLLMLIMALLLPPAAYAGEAESGGYVEETVDIDLTYVRGIRVIGDGLYIFGDKYSDIPPEEPPNTDSPDEDFGPRLLLYQDGEFSRLPLGDTEGIDIQNLCVDEDGNIALLGSESPSEEFISSDNPDWEGFYANRRTGIFTQGEDGGFAPLGEGWGGDVYYDRFYALPGGGYVVQSYESTIIVDKTGAETRRISQQSNGMAVAGNTLYLMDSSDANLQVIAYDALSGEKTGEIPVQVGDNARIWFIGFAADSAGNLYGYDQSGVYKYTKDADSWKKIIDGVASIFGSGNYWSRNFGADDAGNIYAMGEPAYNRTTGMSEDAPLKLYKYSWSDAVENKGEVLRIAGLVDSQTARAAANMFQRAHPEIQVEYTIYGEGLNVQDGLLAMNTEVLAGRGADVLMLDYVPLDSYIEKGYLMDLTEWANGRDTDGTWMPNIARAFKEEDGTLPCLPITFSVPVLWGAKEETDSVRTLQDLVDIAEGLPEGEYLWSGSYGSNSVLYDLYESCFADWVNEEGDPDFSSPAFREYLNACRTIQEHMPESIDYTTTTEEERERQEVENWTNLFEGRTHFFRDSFSYQPNQPEGQAIMEKRGVEAGIVPLPSQSGKKAYYPSQITGISKNTAVSELACAFLDMLVSPETQNSSDMGGLPIHAEALKSKIAVPVYPEGEERWGSSYIGYGSGIEIELKDITPETNAQMTALFASLDTPILADWTLQSMFFEETLPFMEGNRDIDSTISALNSRARIYLME